MFYFSLGILILTEGASLYRKRRSFVFKYIFIGGVILIFGFLFYQSWLQYRVWSQNELSKFLLPPYQSIAYFLGYSFTRFFKNYLISLVVALLFLSAAVFLNKKFQERFFEKEELYLGALAIFLVGHPFWMFYFLAVMTVGVLGSLFLKVTSYHAYRQAGKLQVTSRRFPFYRFWLPLAILVLIIGKVLI